MIYVDIYRNHNNDITGFVTKGHSGYDEAGRDIVCAAVSVLVINTINSIEAFTDTKIDVEKSDDNDDNAVIAVKVAGHQSEKTEVLLQALVLGLTQVAKGNPDYVSITFKEV